MKYQMSAIAAAQKISRYVDGAIIRNLPLVARQEALRAVMLGACPQGVAESMREAA